MQACWIPSARIHIISANCPQMRLPANPLCPYLQHSNPIGRTWLRLGCLTSPVSRWDGVEGSTLARHFTLDHTPMAQSSGRTCGVWGAPAVCPRKPLQSRTSWGITAECGASVASCLLPGSSCTAVRGKHLIPTGLRCSVKQSTLQEELAWHLCT